MNKNIKLIRARKKSKLTQQDLAKRMKVTKSTIS
ncbi:helix-turn-helix transcriptional regulator, partial [Bacillus cereus group sp. BfR-BA-01381]